MVGAGRGRQCWGFQCAAWWRGGVRGCRAQSRLHKHATYCHVRPRWVVQCLLFSVGMAMVVWPLLTNARDLGWWWWLRSLLAGVWRRSLALDNGGEVSHGEPMEGGADLGVAARHSKMYVSMGAPNLYLEYLMDLEWLDRSFPAVVFANRHCRNPNDQAIALTSQRRPCMGPRLEGGSSSSVVPNGSRSMNTSACHCAARVRHRTTVLLCERHLSPPPPRKFCSVETWYKYSGYDGE